MQTGNAYAVGFRTDRNEFDSVHLLPSRGTMPYVDHETKAIFYAAGNNPLVGDLEYMIPQRDVLHVRLHCPVHPLIGVSPVAAAAMSLQTNASITQSQAMFFNNMRRPSGILSTDNKLTRDQMLELRAAFDQQAADMNKGGIPILSNGLKWNQLSVDSQDAQVIDAFHMSVEDVARAYRIPLPLVGDYRNATYNNVEQLISAWLSTGLGFVIEHLELAINDFFALGPNERCNFDTDTLLRTDFAGRVDGYTKAIQNGLMTPNEARARMGGLNPVEEGDTPLVQQQMVPLGYRPEAPANDAPAEPPEDSGAQRAAAVTHLKALLSR